MEISVVIPVYGCRNAIEELYQRLIQTLGSITSHFEIILVNDACPQNSWEIIKKIALNDPRVKGLDLSRNFGQIRAITSGLASATGSWIFVMDCDLQDRPEEMVRLYQKAQEGYDVVFSRRELRKHSFSKRILSKFFYSAYGYFTSGAFDASISNFSISRKIVIENYLRMGDQNRAFILFIKWMGFKSTAISIPHDERFSGKSSYTLKKQLRLATEIITTQSNKPLVFSIQLGFVVAAAAILYAIYAIICYFFQGTHVTGWTSLVVSLYFIGGVIMIQLGILGLYIGYIFDQTKHRPLYIVRETIENGQSKLG